MKPPERSPTRSTSAEKIVVVSRAGAVVALAAIDVPVNDIAWWTGTPVPDVVRLLNSADGAAKLAEARRRLTEAVI